MLHQRTPSWLLLFLISTLTFSWTYLVSKSLSYRDPGSRFFDPSRAYEQRYSAHRSSEAAAYQKTVESWLQNAENAHTGGTIDKWPLGTRRKGEKPEVCAVFITTARKVGTQYIDGAISSALHGLTPAERRLLDLRIYFSNLNPHDHPSYGSWLHNISDAQLSPSDLANPDLLARMQSLATLSNYHAKSGLDYSLALQSCFYNSSAPYIAVFEGDIQLGESWFARLLSALKEVESAMAETGKRWLLLRMFNEERASGFSSSHPLGNNVPLIIVLMDLLLTFLLYTLRRLAGKLGSRRMDFITRNFVLVVTLWTVPVFVILFFQTGKATVLPPRDGVRVENFGCCTQGMVYPRGEVAGLIGKLRERAEEENYDVIIDDYSWKNGEENWLDHVALYPMMAQHLGFSSLISPDRDGDKQIWSMAYENLNPERLYAEHEAMVKSMFGEGAWVDNRP